MKEFLLFLSEHDSAIAMFFTFSTFLFLIYNVRLNTKRTDFLIKNIQFSSYTKQIDDLNMINNLLIEKEELKETFLKFDEYKDLSPTELGFSWLVINRYESVHKAKSLGLIEEEEWEVAIRRMKVEFQYDIIEKVWKKDYFGFSYNNEFKSFVEKEIYNRG